MKRKFLKFTLFLFILLSFLNNPKKIYGFQFYKFQNNPLTINFINDYSYILQIDVYEKNNYGCFGIATARKSTDNFYSLIEIKSQNCINWIMTKEVIRTGKDLSNPRLFIDSNNIKTLFFTQQDGDDFYRIYSTQCDDQLNCSSNANLILDPNKNNQTENHGFFGAKIIKYINQYFMFYGVWGNDGFKIRLAYSNDLQNWTKCPNNLISDGADGPFPTIIDNYLYLFYHKSDSSGIRLVKTNLPLNCNLSFQDLGYQITKTEAYDLKHMIYPSVFYENNNYKIFYSGLNQFNSWNLNLACSDENCSFNFPTPTPTPTQTPLPTPTLVPTKVPLIIIPGFMGSWNKQAILHNENVSYTDWKLAPFVKEYDGLINSLKNLGFKENEDFYIFAYDWRQNVESTIENLNQFLQSKKSQIVNKFSIIGHSLGGLIGRIYSQKYKENVHKIISVASPHQGVVQVYKPLEAGEIDRENTFLWLAQKMILILNKTSLETDRETIRKRFPIAYDLFPTYDFLKNTNGDYISISSLKINNTLLKNYNVNFSNIFDIFTAIYGEKDNKTPIGFVIEPPNILDQTFGNYQDGYPKLTLFDYGDYTVPVISASQDEDSEKLNFDHGEIITKKEAIKKILDLLGISYQDDKISEGQKTNVARSLIFLIKSPAKMIVDFNGSVYEENDGIIFIPDAQTGDYNLKVQGTGLGNYQVVIGQISQDNDLWEVIDGEIVKDPPESQTDDYLVAYNQQKANSIFPSPTLTTTPIVFTPTPTSLFSNNNQNSSSSNSQNQQIYLTITPTPTIILYSKAFNQKTDKIDSQILGEKIENINKNTPTQKNKLYQNQNKFFRNYLLFIIIILLIIFYLVFRKIFAKNTL
ncbi:MAG: hypothetical protein Fur009_4700 [Candidatus Microgenomates bacterium]